MDENHRLVLIRWVDSYGCSTDWNEIANARAIAHECVSVGWIVKDGVDAVVVVPHLSPANDDIAAVEQGCGDMTIPTSAIRSIEDLVLSEKDVEPCIPNAGNEPRA